ncbi:zinc-binding dehydrogenase [Conexibacter sp. S30A1]|uniref:zinc-dependent alcohol dehydrogenase n=1 Tax=Conexibacter sp. S30A1 TaxID=2937800 RepID=UPI0020102154|nr:alcohol dehydrogenase catalytic domain-containing protein [Conexibacter sp. S30A1]
MKALRLHAPGDLRLHEEPVPKCRKGEVLLRVRAVGLCGSDRHWFVEGTTGGVEFTRPIVLGHEILATIESGPNAGQRVAVEPAVPCGNCVVCARGDLHLCPFGAFAGYEGTDGGLRTFMTWPAALCEPVPSTLSDDDAVLLEPLGVALHALDLGHVSWESFTGVVGCGPIGLLLVELLVRAGAARVAVADPLPHRLDAALALHPHVVPLAEVPESELDVVFEVAGSDDALNTALVGVRPGGRIVLIGIPSDDRTGFRASLARRKGVTIALSRRMRADALARAARLAGTGSLRLGHLVSERYALEDAADAFTSLAAYRGIKIIVQLDGGESQ